MQNEVRRFNTQGGLCQLEDCDCRRTHSPSSDCQRPL